MQSLLISEKNLPFLSKRNIKYWYKLRCMDTFHVGYTLYNIFSHKAVWQVYPWKVGENASELIKNQPNQSTPLITQPNSATILCYIPVKLAQTLPNLKILSREMIKVKTCLNKAVSLNFYLRPAFLALTWFENKILNLLDNEQLSGTLTVAYNCTLFS